MNIKRLERQDFDTLFTKDKPTYLPFMDIPADSPSHVPADQHKNLHVRGYKEEGTTTTPFDMCVVNDLDRFHPAQDMIDRVPKLGERAAYGKQPFATSSSSTSSTLTNMATICPKSAAGRGGRRSRGQAVQPKAIMCPKKNGRQRNAVHSSC